jgi:hypothetical protein
MAEDDKLNELLVKCWHDADTRKRFIANPKAVLAENGIDLPPEAEIVVLEDTAKKAHVVLPPMRPQQQQQQASALSDSELDGVSGGAGLTAPAAPTKATSVALQKVRVMHVPTHPSQMTCTADKVCSVVSQRQYKKEIEYLSRADEERVAKDLLSAAIARSGEDVDLYAYTTKAVATLHVQQKQIEALEKQVEDLRRALAENESDE